MKSREVGLILITNNKLWLYLRGEEMVIVLVVCGTADAM